MPFPAYEILRERCVRTLEANLVETRQGLFLAAGGHQFRTLWVRDFCFAVPGLLAHGWHGLVERQLMLILSYMRLGQLPRGIDCTNPKARVLSSLGQWAVLRRPGPLASYRGDLRPEYLGEHGTPAFDSNLLFLRAWGNLVAKGGNWGAVGKQVPELLQPYSRFISDGTLLQPPFSDWQDSARREGAILFMHLLLAEVLSTLDEAGLLPGAFARFRPQIQAFIESRQMQRRFYREQVHSDQIAFDSHAMLLRNQELFKPTPGLYELFKESSLWSKAPGLPVSKFYEAEEVSFTTKLVGLRHYHDGFRWGWLAADAALLAKEHGDAEEWERILTWIEALSREEDYLGEIYERGTEGWVPVQRFLYRSEAPFTWSAGKALEALAAL